MPLVCHKGKFLFSLFSFASHRILSFLFIVFPLILSTIFLCVIYSIVLHMDGQYFFFFFLLLLLIILPIVYQEKKNQTHGLLHMDKFTDNSYSWWSSSYCNVFGIWSSHSLSDCLLTEMPSGSGSRFNKGGLFCLIYTSLQRNTSNIGCDRVPFSFVWCT